jgi:hypothetical protein
MSVIDLSLLNSALSDTGALLFFKTPDMGIVQEAVWFELHFQSENEILDSGNHPEITFRQSNNVILRYEGNTLPLLGYYLYADGVVSDEVVNSLVIADRSIVDLDSLAGPEYIQNVSVPNSNLPTSPGGWAVPPTSGGPTPVTPTYSRATSTLTVDHSIPTGIKYALSDSNSPTSAELVDMYQSAVSSASGSVDFSAADYKNYLYAWHTGSAEVQDEYKVNRFTRVAVKEIGVPPSFTAAFAKLFNQITITR